MYTIDCYRDKINTSFYKKGGEGVNTIIDMISSTSTSLLMVMAGLITCFIMFILIVDLVYNGLGKLSLITKILMLITTFMMCAYILVSATQSLTHTQYIKGTVVAYEYHTDKSQLTLENDAHHQKRYQVSGIANRFKYQEGDYIHVSESQGLIFNVEKINHTVYDPPFAKYHAVFIVLMLMSVATLAYVLLTLYFKSHQNKSQYQPLRETMHVMFAITTIGLIGLFTVLVVILPSTDTRTQSLKGRVIDTQLRLDDTHTYVVKEDKTHIMYIVNDKQKRQGHVYLEISKPSHNVTHVISKS